MMARFRTYATSRTFKPLLLKHFFENAPTFGAFSFVPDLNGFAEFHQNHANH